MPERGQEGARRRVGGGGDTGYRCRQDGQHTTGSRVQPPHRRMEHGEGGCAGLGMKTLPPSSLLLRANALCSSPLLTAPLLPCPPARPPPHFVNLMHVTPSRPG